MSGFTKLNHRKSPLVKIEKKNKKTEQCRFHIGPGVITFQASFYKETGPGAQGRQ